MMTMHFDPHLRDYKDLGVEDEEELLQAFAHNIAGVEVEVRSKVTSKRLLVVSKRQPDRLRRVFRPFLHNIQLHP